MISDATLRSPEVFAEMARRFYGRVYFTALGIVRQPDIAEDIAQETFLRAWLKRDTIKEPALLLQPWLVRIATNLALQWLRTGQQRSRLLPLIPMEEVTVEPVDGTRPDPREAAGAAEQRSQVEQAVMALPTELRQVVLLHYAEGLSPSDIARMNGEAPSTVTRRLEKARVQLRQHLENGVAAGLALLKPRHGQTQKVFGLITAAAAIPAATRAQLLQLAADTPPPPMLEAVTSAANAATLEEAGIMKSIIAKVGAVKLLAGAAAVAAVGGGVYGVKSLTTDEPVNNPDGIELTRSISTRVTALDSETAKTEYEIRAGTAGLETPRLARLRSAKSSESVNTHPAETTSALAGTELSQQENVTSTGEAIAGYVTVRGKVSDVETSRPLVNAIVRAVAPGKDMRDLRKPEDAAKLPTTRSDSEGKYEIRVPIPVAAENLSLDVFYPGFRSLSGTYTAGGDYSKHRIPVMPGQVLNLDLNLPLAIYIAGRVVDDNGVAISNASVWSTLESKNGSGGVASAWTDENGRFEIFDFPLESDQYFSGWRGVLHVNSKDHVTTSIPDIYDIPHVDRSRIEITLEKGHSVAGQLLQASGEPAANVRINLEYDASGYPYRTTNTDSAGNFIFNGLKPGNGLLYARATSLDQWARESIAIPVSGDLTLNMAHTPAADESRAVNLLGMKLIEVTPELASKYDLRSTSGILVLDPGTQTRRLGITTERHSLAEGDYFVIIGDKRIKSLKHFAAEALRVNALPVVPTASPAGYEGYVRVVYSFNRYRGNGTNTQYMRLTPEDIRELEAFLEQQ